MIQEGNDPSKLSQEKMRRDHIYFLTLQEDLKEARSHDHYKPDPYADEEMTWSKMQKIHAQQLHNARADTRQQYYLDYSREQNIEQHKLHGEHNLAQIDNRVLQNREAYNIETD